MNTEEIRDRLLALRAGLDWPGDTIIGDEVLALKNPGHHSVQDQTMVLRERVEFMEQLPGGVYGSRWRCILDDETFFVEFDNDGHGLVFLTEEIPAEVQSGFHNTQIAAEDLDDDDEEERPFNP